MKPGLRSCSRLAAVVTITITLTLALVGCGPSTPAFPDRQPGARTPLSSTCDPIDPTRCALPWPSNTFTVADASTRTGLRLAVDRRALLGGEDVSFLNVADGFSRMSPLMTAFPGALSGDSLGSGADTAMRLLVAQPGAAAEAQSIPLRLSVVNSTSARNGEESLLIGYPLRPLDAGADHVVLVLDSLRAADGSAFEADHRTKVSLGLDAPADDSERQRFAYHAPTRALLKRAQIDPQHVLRVWDFTTRSAENPRARLESMRSQAIAAVTQDAIGVAIDTVTIPDTGSVAAIVEGRLTGLPSFRNDQGTLALDDSGLPKANGTHDAPFRVMIPKGSGDYRLVMYGHGTGGSVHDDTFDEQIAEQGLGKANGLFYGWDDQGIYDTLIGLGAMQTGVARSSAGLMQALADDSALEEALNGFLADTLSAPMLKDVANPAAGRRPDALEPIWTGGSLGGTLGMVYAGLSPRVRYAVLNVPGAGWTHFIPGSQLFDLVGPSLQANYPSALDFNLSLNVSQLSWDEIDGGNWSDDLEADGSVYLVQESMGDPVLPNPGSELCATAVKAVQVGAVLAPVTGLSTADRAEGHSGLTQFRVPDGVEGLKRHGFGGGDTIAGQAAREQIMSFLHSALEGHPLIGIPLTCRDNTVPDSCDFSAASP